MAQPNKSASSSAASSSMATTFDAQSFIDAQLAHQQQQRSLVPLSPLPPRLVVEFPDADPRFVEHTARVLIFICQFDNHRPALVRATAEASRAARAQTLVDKVTVAGALMPGNRAAHELRAGLSAAADVTAADAGHSSPALVKLLLTSLNLQPQDNSLAPFTARAFNDVDVFTFVQACAFWTHTVPRHDVALTALIRFVMTRCVPAARHDLRAQVAQCKTDAQLLAFVLSVPDTVLLNNAGVAFNSSSSISIAAIDVTPPVVAPPAAPAAAAPSVAALAKSNKGRGHGGKSASSSSSSASSSASSSSTCAFCNERHPSYSCPKLLAHRTRCSLGPMLMGRRGCYACDVEGHASHQCTKFSVADIKNGLTKYMISSSLAAVGGVARRALHVDATVNAVPTAITLDTGATTSCADAAFVARVGGVVTPASSQARVPGGSSVTFVGTTQLPLSIGNTTISPSLDVLPALGHNVLLGVDVLFPADRPSDHLVLLPPSATSTPTTHRVSFAQSGPLLARSAPVVTATATSTPPPPPPAATPSAAASPDPPFYSAIAAIDDAYDVECDTLVGSCVVENLPYVFELHGVNLCVDARDNATICHASLPPRALAAIAALDSCAAADVDARLLAVLSAINAAPDLESADALFEGDSTPPPATAPPDASPSLVSAPDFIDAHISPGVSDDTARRAALLLRQHANVFGGSRRPGTLQAPPPCNARAFSITLAPDADVRRVRAAQRRYSPEAMSAMRAQVAQWVTAGIVERSTATYSSAPVAVRKRNGEWRMCIDYRTLNAQSLFSQQPMARVRDCVDRCTLAKRSIQADMWSYFNQIPITDELTRALLSFAFDGHLYTFCKAPFGPSGVPAHGQEFMNTTFDKPTDSVYADDYNAVIIDDTDDACIASLKSLVERADAAHLTMRADKLFLFYARFTVLGYEVSDGVAVPSQDHLLALQHTAYPVSREELRRFLHAASPWRAHLPLWSTTAAPLLAAAKPAPTPFALDVECRRAFGALRDMLASPVVTGVLDPSRPVSLRTDFSSHALSWVVYQDGVDGVPRVLHCGGRQCDVHERHNPAARGELLALREAVRALPHFLGKSAFPFVWYTDNKPMVTSQTSALSPDTTIARWQLELQATPFRAVYTRGASGEQALPDFLSRLTRQPRASATRPPHPRDAGTAPSHLLQRLMRLPEFAAAHDKAAAVLAWLRAAPATPRALAVWPAVPAPSSTAPTSLSALFIGAFGTDSRDDAYSDDDDDANDGIAGDMASAAYSDTSLPPPALPPIDAPPANAPALAVASSPVGTPASSLDSTPPAIARSSPSPVPSSLLPLPPPTAIDGSAIPLATLGDARQRIAAWRGSILRDPTLAPLRAAAEAHRGAPVASPTAFYDDEGLLRVPVATAPAPLTDATSTLPPTSPTSSTAIHASRIVVPRDRVEEVFASYHHGAFGGHFHPLRAISTTFWWPRMRADIDQLRGECIRCQAFAATPARGEASFTGADAERFAVVSIDLATMPASANGMQYILICVDQATGTIEAAAMRDRTAATTAAAFERVWLHRYGVPIYVLSDNGPEFEGAFLALERYGLTLRRSSAYNPRGNSIAERAVRSLKERLDKLCVRANGSDWPDHLSAALAPLRMYAGDRGASPFELLHGAAPRLPAAARLVGPARRGTPTSLAMTAERTRALLVAAQARRLARQQQDAARIGTQHVEQLAVHDIVLWQSHTANSKFASRRHWIGPFIILAEAPFGGYYQLARPDGAYVTPRYVPARQLKLFIGDPFSPDSPAILAEPGARPWLGLDIDASLLGERFTAIHAQHGASSAAVRV